MTGNPYSPSPSDSGQDAVPAQAGATEPPPGDASDDGDSRRRPLDLFSATTLVAASMIGAGVFTTSGFTLGDLGSPWWVMAAWTVAGAIAFCGAICYGALATEFAESGGEYLFLSRALHPVAGVMAGWVSLLAGFTGAIAFAATTLAEYSLPLLPDAISGGHWVTTSLASTIIVTAATLHTIGVKPGARVQDMVVALKFLLIAAFVVVALVAVAGTSPTRPAEGVPAAGQGAVGATAAVATNATQFIFRFATALMWISLSYSGFNAAVYVAGEVENPRRNVRLAILLGTVMVTIAYLLLNAVFVFAAPFDAIVNQQQVATIAAEAIGGGGFATFVRVVILVCLFTSVSALVMTGPRVYSKMADDGVLFRWFRFDGRPPAAAIWFQAALAIVVVAVSRLQSLLGYLGFTLSVSAALTASLLLFIKVRPGAIPWYPLPPVLFVGATLLTASLAAYRDPGQAIVGTATILLGAVLYAFHALYQRHRDRHAGTP